MCYGYAAIKTKRVPLRHSFCFKSLKEISSNERPHKGRGEEKNCSGGTIFDAADDFVNL